MKSYCILLHQIWSCLAIEIHIQWRDEMPLGQSSLSFQINSDCWPWPRSLLHRKHRADTTVDMLSQCISSMVTICIGTHQSEHLRANVVSDVVSILLHIDWGQRSLCTYIMPHCHHCQFPRFLLEYFFQTLTSRWGEALTGVRVNVRGLHHTWNHIQRSECCLSLRPPALASDIPWFTFSAVESRCVLLWALPRGCAALLIQGHNHSCSHASCSLHPEQHQADSWQSLTQLLCGGWTPCACRTAA